jgi:hypothetical protein
VDLIPYAIEQAHARGIALYADIPVFAVWGLDKPFLDANPHTLTRTRAGETARMFSPAYPNVRAYKRAIILEWLSRYAVDGIQLDFIRWPYEGGNSLYGYCEHGYDEPLLRELRRRHGLADDFFPEPHDPRFLTIRQQYVSRFIRELRNILDANGIDLPIGVYNSNTFGRRASLRDVCQDWATWEREGLVDEHHPMFVLDSTTRLVRATQSLMEVKGPASTVFGPIFLSAGFRPSPETCRDAARRLIKLGCDGIWFCRNSEIEAFGLWPVVKEISTYSLSAIRREPFDPLYENLIVNGDFKNGLEGWRVEPVGAARVEEGGGPAASETPVLTVPLQSDQAICITQCEARQFLAYAPYGVRSLGLSCLHRSAGIEAETAIQVFVALGYSNGEAATEAATLAPNCPNWSVARKEFRVSRSKVKVLQSAAVRIEVPRGRGTVWLDSLEMIYDPLDDPSKLPDLEVPRDGLSRDRRQLPGPT